LNKEVTMVNKLTKRLRPTHPGEILREDVLPALGITKTRFAELLHVSRQTLYDLLGEKQPVTPQMALRLGRLLGNGPDIWLRLQGAHDLATQAEVLAPELDQIRTLELA
jgi:addiction module HigA family antidote